MEGTACCYPNHSYYGVTPSSVFYVTLGFYVLDASTGFVASRFNASTLLLILLYFASATVIQAVLVFMATRDVLDLDVIPR